MSSLGGLKKPSKDLLWEEERLHSGCSITIWLMLSRSSSKLTGLQTTMGTCPALLPDAGHLFSCRASSIRQGCQGNTAVLSADEATGTLLGYKEIFERFTALGNHVVRYSCHNLSGTWCDIYIEQRLMKAAKSEGGLIRGMVRNSDSGHKCWVTTSPMSTSAWRKNMVHSTKTLPKHG